MRWGAYWCPARGLGQLGVACKTWLCLFARLTSLDLARLRSTCSTCPSPAHQVCWLCLDKGSADGERKEVAIKAFRDAHRNEARWGGRERQVSRFPRSRVGPCGGMVHARMALPMRLTQQGPSTWHGPRN